MDLSESEAQSDRLDLSSGAETYQSLDLELKTRLIPFSLTELKTKALMLKRCASLTRPSSGDFQEPGVDSAQQSQTETADYNSA